MREAGGGACWCEYDSSAVLSASFLLPRFNTFSPDDFGFRVLSCTVAVAVAGGAGAPWWCDCREPPEESPGLRTHIASMAVGETGCGAGRKEKWQLSGQGLCKFLARNLGNQQFIVPYRLRYCGLSSLDWLLNYHTKLPSTTVLRPTPASYAKMDRPGDCRSLDAPSPLHIHALARGRDQTVRDTHSLIALLARPLELATNYCTHNTTTQKGHFRYRGALFRNTGLPHRSRARTRN